MIWNHVRNLLKRQDKYSPPAVPHTEVPAPDAQAALVQLAHGYVQHLQREIHSLRRWQRLRRALLVVAMLLGLLGVWWPHLPSLSGASKTERVAVIGMRGTIGPSNEIRAASFAPALRKAMEDERVKRVVLYIDSPGGLPAEAERMAALMDELRAKHNKPITVVAGNALASAAYLMALHADHIVVPSYALVGSIGAVISAWDFSGLLKRFDIDHRSYASGRYKAMLSPFEPQDEQARQKAQELVDQVGDMFAQELRARRGSKLDRDVRWLATGEVWSGQKAVALGLADEVGTLESVLRQYEPLQPESYGALTPSLQPWWVRATAAIGMLLGLDTIQ